MQHWLDSLPETQSSLGVESLGFRPSTLQSQRPVIYDSLTNPQLVTAG